ncbi:GNAT family N-acetyltransferase [Hyphomonas sp.]|uniref:GNAT family N-acetyltransferase n=1 Tax=Hyphomonas sp. TaxID=87 RepID=UPI0030FB2E93
MQIVPGDFEDARVLDLLRTHLDGMYANSPPGNVFALDLTGLKAPGLRFYTAWEGKTLMGMGALKGLDDGGGEIKSMRTHEVHLRKGVAARLLEHIIAEARARAYHRLSLETGSGPAFDAALALYWRYGFIEGGAFGDYEKSDFNQFFHLAL